MEEKREIITAEDAIKRIINYKPTSHTTIRGKLVLDDQVKGKSIQMTDVNIRGNLILETSITDLIIRNSFILSGGGIIDLRSAEIAGRIDLSGTMFDILYAEGAIALAAHMSLQSNIVSSPSKFFFFH